MIPDVPAAVEASVRSTSDRPIPHPRQEPTMTAPRPSPAGLSPLLDQLDEARAKGTPGEWWVDGPGQRSGGWWIYALGHKFARREDAELIVAEHNAVPKLIRLAREREALRQAVAELATELDAEASACSDITARIALRDAAARIEDALTAALTPGADTAGATA